MFEALRRHRQCVKMPPATGGPVGYTPPEGGWGWAVVVGAFISIGFSYAFPKSITVFFKEIEVIFNATSSQVSWISSIMLAVMYAGGQFHLLLSLLSILVLTVLIYLFVSIKLRILFIYLFCKLHINMLYYTPMGYFITMIISVWRSRKNKFKGLWLIRLFLVYKNSLI